MMPNDGPLVSVVIPCFNAERWIGDTIESVYRQTWRDIELIVVNDGSTDNSRAEIARQKSPLLTVEDQANRGQTAALNVGLAKCKGAFIQYLDADDVLAPGKIERQVRRLQDNIDCVATSSWRVLASSDGLPVEDGSANAPGAGTTTLPIDWLVENWREGGGMMFPAMWLAPANLVRCTGAWAEELNLYNDTEYFTRLVLAARGVIAVPDAVCYYRKGHPSLSGLRTPKAWRSGFKVIELCTGRLLAVEKSDRTTRVCSFLWQRFANACYPHDRALGREAERRAKSLHRDRLHLPGGPVYNLISSVLGWKVARSLQVMLGRT